MTQNNRAEWWAFHLIQGKRKYLWCLKVRANLRQWGGRATNTEFSLFQPQPHMLCMQNTCMHHCMSSTTLTIQEKKRKKKKTGLSGYIPTSNISVSLAVLCHARSQSHIVPNKKKHKKRDVDGLVPFWVVNPLYAVHNRSIWKWWGRPNSAGTLSLTAMKDVFLWRLWQPPTVTLTVNGSQGTLRTQPNNGKNTQM